MKENPFSLSFPAPAAPVELIPTSAASKTPSTFQSEIKETLTDAMAGSYKNGIDAGILESQIIFLNILNNASKLSFFSVDDLRHEFMKRTNEKLSNK